MSEVFVLNEDVMRGFDDKTLIKFATTRERLAKLGIREGIVDSPFAIEYINMARSILTERGVTYDVD